MASANHKEDTAATGNERGYTCFEESFPGSFALCILSGLSTCFFTSSSTAGEVIELPIGKPVT